MNFLDFNNSKLTSFEPTEFYSEGFSVDEFIQRKRYTVPLDVLRDDLGAHLKSLRSSLIELINQDYGHFVNLSSNLVGLDGKIQSITDPLAWAQNEIEILNASLVSTVEDLEKELEDRRLIRTTKNQIQLLQRVHTCLESSEKYLGKCPQEIRTSAEFITFRVACDKVADTRQLIHRCLPCPILEKLQLRWESCCTVLLQKLGILVRIYGEVGYGTRSSDAVDNSEVNITSILFIYSQLRKEVEAEEIFINDILKPKCNVVLAKKGNISALLAEIENFIQTSPIVNASKELEKYPWMKGFDFLGRCVFPHVVTILMKQFPHIWSPSTPDAFHSNWVRCSAFVKLIENSLPSLDHLEKFRSTDILKEFFSKWQFNVYFQLRFHALAIEMEAALESLFSACPTPEFRLDITRVLVRVVSQCWNKEKVFIVQISGRFLKASALFISRYLKAIHSQVTSSPKVTLDELIAISADLTLSELTLRQILSEKIERAVEDITNPYTVSLPSLHTTNTESENGVGARFLSLFAWNTTREAVEAKLIESTVTQSAAFISSVNEVPRLFRRTNRDAPTKPSEYVTGILQPIQTFHSRVKDAKQGDLLERIGPKVGQQILNRYKTQMDDVLISVQRMEESLKRLKKVKGQNQVQPSNGLNLSDSKSNINLSDDDKIRRQIQLDYEYLNEQIRAITVI